MAIRLNNVSFSYGEQKVIENFSLTVLPGEAVCLFGESGCGKTTLLRIIAGLEKIDSGELEAPEKIAVVFQEDRLFTGLNPLKSIAVVSDEQTALQLLTRAGMQHLKSKRLSNLSGGMKRRIAILRALSFEADALILDEPFNALDFENKQLMADLILEKFKNKPIIMVSHNKEDAELLGARIINLTAIKNS